MSDTKITAKVDADLSQLKAGMREASWKPKEGGSEHAELHQPGQRLIGQGRKGRPRMREEFDRILKLNQEPSADSSRI